MVLFGSTFTSFLGALLLIVTIIAVPFLSAQIESGESQLFTFGGLQLDPVTGLDSTNDILGVSLRTQTNGGASSFSDGSVQFICEGGVGLTRTPMVATLSNLSTNLTVFGEEYASVVLDRPAAECGPQTVPGITGDQFSFQIFWNVDRDEIFASEALRFVINGDDNHTISGFSIDYFVLDGPGTGTLVVTDSFVVDPLQVCVDCAFGKVIQTPLTTQDRIQIQSLDAPDANDAEYLRWTIFMKASDAPVDGEVLIFDTEGAATEEGLLTSTTRQIVINLIGGSLIFLGAILALKSVSLASLRTSLRGDSRAQATGFTMITVIGILFLLLILIFFLGGFSSLQAAFSVSLLPLALGVTAFAIVAFTTRGRANLTFALLFASGAFAFFFIVGLAIQATLLDFRRLYVEPFLSLFSGDLATLTFVAFSAAFVVIAIIFAILVMTWNAINTIGTDEGIRLFR